MIKKLKIYLDTSVINFLFADDAPEKKEVTIDFFDNFVLKEIYQVFISSIVVEEIERTDDILKREQLLNIIKKYPIKFIDNIDTEEILNLAKEYLNQNILPKNSEADALHVAISTVNQMDILLSWNFKHLANYNRKKKIQLLNLQNNYSYPFDILTPIEVVNENT